MENIDGTISVNDIESKSCGVYLLLTKPDDILPIMKINVEIADTELENNEIDINIMGTLAEQEHEIPSADVLAKSIMDDYQSLKPWIKEGIIHRMSQHDDPKRTVSRFLESKI